MKCVREGKGTTPTDTSRFLTKVKTSLKRTTEQDNSVSESFVPSFEIIFMKKMFTCRYEVKPQILA